MTRYIVRYRNGNIVILSGEDNSEEQNTETNNYVTNSENSKHSNTEYEISVLTKKTDNSNANSDKDSTLINVLTSPILNMVKLIFQPFIADNSKEESQ